MTESEAVAAGAIGEEAIVANAVEAIRQCVQQEPADELVGIEGHHLGLAARLVVFPGEADFAVGKREQPAVGDRHPMGIGPR
jgi:hypothetical protein